MGLDGVEFVLAIEDCFGIEIDDAIAEQLGTVGAVQDHIWSLLRASQDGRCPTQHSFYRLRHALCSEFSVPRDKVRPATSIMTCLNSVDLRPQWQTLGQAMGVSMPPLERPQRMESVLMTATVGSALAIAPAILLAALPAPSMIGELLAPLPVMMFVVFVLGIISYLCTIPLKRFPSADCATVGGLARRLSPMKGRVTNSWTEVGVHEEVVRILRGDFDIHDEAIHREAKFIDLFGP